MTLDEAYADYLEFCERNEVTNIFSKERFAEIYAKLQEIEPLV